MVVSSSCAAHHGGTNNGIHVVAVSASELVKCVCFVNRLGAAGLGRHVVIHYTDALMHEMSRANKCCVASCASLSSYLNILTRIEVLSDCVLNALGWNLSASLI